MTRYAARRRPMATTASASSDVSQGMGNLGTSSAGRVRTYTRWLCRAPSIEPTPSTTSAMPSALDGQWLVGAEGPAGAEITVRNKPNLATTKPSAINVSPDRTHARNVRSAAKKTRGSEVTLGRMSLVRYCEQLPTTRDAFQRTHLITSSARI